MLCMRASGNVRVNDIIDVVYVTIVVVNVINDRTSI